MDRIVSGSKNKQGVGCLPMSSGMTSVVSLPINDSNYQINDKAGENVANSGAIVANSRDGLPNHSLTIANQKGKLVHNSALAVRNSSDSGNLAIISSFSDSGKITNDDGNSHDEELADGSAKVEECHDVTTLMNTAILVASDSGNLAEMHKVDTDCFGVILSRDFGLAITPAIGEPLEAFISIHGKAVPSLPNIPGNIAWLYHANRGVKMQKEIALNGQWKRVILYLNAHTQTIFVFELGMLAGVILALLVIRLVVMGG